MRQGRKGRHPRTPRAENSHKRSKGRSCKWSGLNNTRNAQPAPRGHSDSAISASGRDATSAVRREAGDDAPTSTKTATATSVPSMNPVWDRFSHSRHCSVAAAGPMWCVVPSRHGEKPFGWTVVPDSIFQGRRQPGHQAGGTSSHRPLEAPSPIPPGNCLDDSPAPDRPVREVSVSERESAMQNRWRELLIPSAMAIPRCTSR